jgi:hypothetical protein
VSLPPLEYRVLIRREEGESERLHETRRQVVKGQILNLNGERVVVREILEQPSPEGPGVVIAEPADHFRPGY